MVSATLLGAGAPALAQPARVLGTDISYWNSEIPQTGWNTAYSTGNRKFAQLRATRGGTTGVDQKAGFPGGSGLQTLSQRYDDPRFVQNLKRATTAGLIVGPYHYARPDVAGNTGADEADHMIQMAGAWMRPGYTMPMYDMEAGGAGNAQAQFAIDFSARICAVMQIRPCIYVGGSYSSALQNDTATLRDQLAKPQSATPSVVGPAFSMLWNPRYATTPDVQTDNPKDTYAGFYGPWDDYGDPNPWSFWQYSSSVAIPGFPDTTCDGDVSHGDIEYVRNYLVPAVWWNDSSGDWSTLANWNSGQPPVAPVTPANQPPLYETGGLPTARLPGAAGSGPTSGQYDTVILERPNANITVTLSTGTHNIRKLYMRETLNLTGGSLTVNYNPAYRANDSATVLHGGPISAQFSGPVTLGGSASLTLHTLQVDINRTLTLSGGTLTVNTINLMPHASTPAKIVVNGNVNFNSLAGATATITNGTGSGSSGSIDLGGASRAFNVANGAAVVDLSVDVTVTNGALSKTGLGTLRLGCANSYGGGTTISAGTLEGVVASSIPGNVTNHAGTLKLDSASALASGATLVLASAPGAGAVNLNFAGTQTISALYFGTTQQAAGTWAAAGATHNHTAFTGSGILNVTTGLGPSSTAVSRTSGSSPATYGDSLTFTATATGNSPGGTVQFKVDGAAAGSPVALVSGSASLVVSTLSVSGSPHQITAFYSGDDNNSPSDSSASPISQAITARSTACALTSSVNPSGPGTNVTFTATVNQVPPAAELPTGNVVFSANGTPFATNGLVSGSISASTAPLPLGTNTMTARYVGGGNFLGSTGSVAQVVKLSVTCGQANALLSMAHNLNGTFTLTFLGTPQAEYYVLASPDVAAPMASWAPVAGSTNTVTNVSGLWQFTVTNTTSRQFYRSRPVVPCPGP